MNNLIHTFPFTSLPERHPASTNTSCSNYSFDFGKVVCSYLMLAYYYVSFALAAPEILMELQLPYHEEYLLAKSMRNRSN